MKIMQFDELAQLPKGTVFCEWDPSVANDMFVKGDSHKFGSQPDAWSFYEKSLTPTQASDNEDDPPVVGFGWIRRLKWDTNASGDQLYAVF